MQTTTERPARGAGAIPHRLTKAVHSVDSLKGGHSVPTPPKGISAVHTLSTPTARQRRKLIPYGVPFDDLSPGQQEAVRSLRKLRKQMAAEIERMIAFLDETDGYSSVELEDDGAEPSDVALRAGLRRYGPPAAGNLEDDEPSLGSIEDHPNPYRDGTDYPGRGRDQSYWAGGSADDCEGDEHDGREPDDDEGGEAEKEDDEPSLGWTDVETRCGRYVNNGADLEIDEVRV